MTKKEIVILKHVGGRLGNQLWLYSAVYAYCLEKGHTCTNPSFFPYNKYFDFKESSIIIKLLGFVSGPKINNNHAASYIIYLIYKTYSSLLPILFKGEVVKVGYNQQIDNLSQKIERSKSKRIYLDCRELNNPKGMKKYHNQIVKKFKPKEEIIMRANNFIKRFGNHYLIGVHIRQGDYKRFMGGKFYFEQSEIANILKYFKVKNETKNKKVKFILFSNSSVDLKKFSGLDVTPGIGSNYIIEDMLAMSMCDAILATVSSFSTYAAYYGNKPLYIFGHKNKLVKYKHRYENHILFNI